MARLIQRKRTLGWRQPEGAIYIGYGSKWANPITKALIRKDYEFTEEWQYWWRKDATAAFERWLRNPDFYGGLWPERRQWILDHLHLLAAPDVILMGWCGDWEPGEPEIYCHGIILLKMAMQEANSGG